MADFKVTDAQRCYLAAFDVLLRTHTPDEGRVARAEMADALQWMRDDVGAKPGRREARDTHDEVKAARLSEAA